MSEEIYVFDRLLQIALLIEEDLARAFADTELTVARTHLLWELHRLGPSTEQALASTLKVSPRNVTGLVERWRRGVRDSRSHTRPSRDCIPRSYGCADDEMERQRRQTPPNWLLTWTLPARGASPWTRQCHCATAKAVNEAGAGDQKEAQSA